MSPDRFVPTDDEQQLVRAVREVLQKECPPEHVRACWSDATGRSDTLWRALADVGLSGVTIPEPAGGLGLGDDVLALLLVECGRVALPEPVVECAAVGASLLADVGDPDGWLPRVAAGEARLAVRVADEPFVSDAHVATVLLAAVDGAVVAVPRDALTLQPQPTIDGARRLFSVGWPARSARVLADGEPARAAVAAARDRGALATAAVLIGLGERLVETTAAYARDRQQFGRPIGSFQAVKHQLADALLGVEFARPLVHRAGWSLAARAAHRSRDASAAKLSAGRAAARAARVALQVHGAIGYSYEHDLQLWLKRVWALTAAWGDADYHRERIRTALVDEGPTRSP